MFDDLAAYYHENVVAAFLEYRDRSNDGVAGRSRDLRAALNAAAALFHLREHLPRPGAPTRAQVEPACPDYALLGDVANAAKHKILTSATPHGAPLVSAAADLEEQIDLIEYEDDEGSYRYIQKSVIVKLVDGSERNLLDVLTNVLNFWEQHMHQLGVLSSARTFQHGANVRLRSRSECEECRLDFELVQGYRFKQKMRFLRFNTESGKAEPVDLTGAKARFRVYRPKFEVDLSSIQEDTG